MARKQREAPKLQGDTSPIAEKTTGDEEEKLRALMRKHGHAPWKIRDLRKRGEVGRPEKSELAVECAYCKKRFPLIHPSVSKCSAGKPQFGAGEADAKPGGELAQLEKDIEWMKEE